MGAWMTKHVIITLLDGFKRQALVPRSELCQIFLFSDAHTRPISHMVLRITVYIIYLSKFRTRDAN